MAQLPIVRELADVFPRGTFGITGACIAKGKALANTFYDWQPAIAAYHADGDDGAPSRWIYTPEGVVLVHLDGSPIVLADLQAYLIAFE
jgi:hypothetical protein